MGVFTKIITGYERLPEGTTGIWGGYQRELAGKITELERF